MSVEIGFMQGRLSDPIDGRIQAFPVEHWREELATAERIDLRLMEWTLDLDALDENPLMTVAGRREIDALATRHKIQIPSLTADFFMQRPFFKLSTGARQESVAVLKRVIEACVHADIGMIVVPLVDNGRLDTADQAIDVENTFLTLLEQLACSGLRILFESDLPPTELRGFILRFPPPYFGINYDIGNSASLGFDPAEEIATYGEFIHNVHVKDRLLGGSSVPLGCGDADVRKSLQLLVRSGYAGNYILQTARATDGDHAGAIAGYRDLVRQLLEQSAFAA